MASFLDTGLLDVFSVIFIFLLVYSILWGLLTFRKPFGDNKGIYAVLSLTVAFFFVLSKPARAYVEFVAPWFLVLAIVFFLIIISVSMFAEVDWMNVLKHDTARTWIIILIALIIILGLAFSFGQTALEAGGTVPVVNPETEQIRDAGIQGGTTTSGDYEANLVNTIFHPKVLGLMLIFLLGTFVIFFLSRSSDGK